MHFWWGVKTHNEGSAHLTRDKISRFRCKSLFVQLIRNLHEWGSILRPPRAAAEQEAALGWEEAARQQQYNAARVAYRDEAVGSPPAGEGVEGCVSGV